MKLFPLGLLLFLLGSCSSFSWKNFFGRDDSAQKRNEKLMDDFAVDSTLKQKFTLREKEEKTPEERTDSKTSQDIKKKAPLSQEKPKRKAIRPQPPKKKLVSQRITPPKKDYPADFPKKLKAFDTHTKKFWDTVGQTFFPGEEMILKITYMGINTGKITIKTKDPMLLGDTEVNHFHARIKTSNYYSYLYEVDDFCDSYVGKKDFLPRKFSLIQRESSQNIDDLQLFDLENLQTVSLYKRETDKKVKKKKLVKSIPKYFQDPLSIVFFLRGLPLEKKATYEIPVANQGKVEIMQVKTGSQEQIKTKLGKRLAHVLKITTHHKGKTIKGGDMTFWYSADERKIFLKFKAEIKIGSIQGEIESYQH